MWMTLLKLNKNMKAANEAAGMKLLQVHLMGPRSPDLIFNLLHKMSLIFNLLP